MLSHGGHKWDVRRGPDLENCADQLYEALDAFRAAARLMRDPALKMAIGDVLQEVSAAGVAKVLLTHTVASYHVQSAPSVLAHAVVA